MTLFWTYAAGLILLAMAFIVIPLLRKYAKQGLSSDELNLTVFQQQLKELDSDLSSGILEQDQYDAARRDLEKELLLDVSGSKVEKSQMSSSSGKWMLISAFMVPLVALLLYQVLGSPKIIELLASGPVAQAAEGGMQSPHAQAGSTGQMPPMDELVHKLEAKLEAQPDNIQGWTMLARSYVAMGQPDKATGVYERALKIKDDDVDLLLSYAEHLGKQANNNFTGRAAELIEKAYALDQQGLNNLWLMGIVEYQRGSYQKAIERWESLADKLGPQSQDLANVDQAINDARERLGMEPKFSSIVPASDQPAVQPAPAETAADSGSAIRVKISLAPELQAKASPEQTVFIYAKAISGPPMPLAAMRKQVKDLPIEITLDDSLAMMPQMKLSLFPEVVVGARVSLSGSGPGAKPGDLQGEIKPVKPGQSAQVDVVINSVYQ